MEGLIMEFNQLDDFVQDRVLDRFAESEASMFREEVGDFVSDIVDILERVGIYAVPRSIMYDTNKGYFVFSGTYSYSIDSRNIGRYCGDQCLLEAASRLELLQCRNDYSITADITAGRTIVEVAAYDGDGLYASDFGDEIEDIFNDICQWAVRRIELEFEYRTSREYLIETIEANGYEFDEDGGIL